jgi:cytoskeleton protein RodZ
MGHLGEVLREARRRKGVTLAQAEKVTRIQAKYLKALEDEDYESLPGHVYAKGYLRNYAQYLSLDPDKVMQLYPSYFSGASNLQPDEPILPPATKPLPARARRVPSFAVILAFVILAGVVFAWVYSALLGPSNIVPTPTIPVPTPTEVIIQPTGAPVSAVSPVSAASTVTATTQPAEPTATHGPYVGIEVQARFISDSWILVQVDGQQVFVGTIPAGSVKTWQGQSTVMLWSGNATQVEVTVNGENKGRLGDTDVAQKEFKLP